MVFDFYPNADGLFIESSDYAACHCPACGARYYDNEFRFVKAISEEIWQKDRKAMIVVYPHYFTGAEVPGLKVRAARQPFDSRWTVFFTPHSAHSDSALIAKANGIATAPWCVAAGFSPSDGGLKAAATLKYPLFVKPACEGSSMGVTSKSLCHIEHGSAPRGSRSSK